MHSLHLLSALWLLVGYVTRSQAFVANYKPSTPRLGPLPLTQHLHRRSNPGEGSSGPGSSPPREADTSGGWIYLRSQSRMDTLDERGRRHGSGELADLGGAEMSFSHLSDREYTSQGLRLLTPYKQATGERKKQLHMDSDYRGKVLMLIDEFQKRHGPLMDRESLNRQARRHHEALSDELQAYMLDWKQGMQEKILKARVEQVGLKEETEKLEALKREKKRELRRKKNKRKGMRKQEEREQGHREEEGYGHRQMLGEIERELERLRISGSRPHSPQKTAGEEGTDAGR